MTGRMAGQTINDRLLAARHSLAGQGLAKSVCKATTEEMIGPKKKHLDYLVHCTNEPNVSIPQLANLLVERSQNTNWVVVYKALVTCHHMMCYGNERFTQYLASSNSTFQLSNFLDKSGVQGIILSTRIGYDMSPFVRRYARYLNEKALSYRTLAFDFCKIKRGKDDGMLRTMNADKLLKTLPVLQNQLDALLEFDCSSTELTNGVINMCFMLLFRDLIRLFACYNDGIINLLEKYFDMNKKQCKEALDIYKKFLVRMDKVSDFLKVAENIGIDKGEIPDLTKAPSSLLEALEQHLLFVDGKKAPTKDANSSLPSMTNGTSHYKNKSGSTTFATNNLNAFEHSAATSSSNGYFDANGVDENLKLQILAEEEAAINQFKSKISPTNTNNPFISPSDSASSKSITESNFFHNESTINTASSKSSDDLLQLSNPFVDNFTTSEPQTAIDNAWMTNGNGIASNSGINGTFVNENNFMTVFGNTQTNTAQEADHISSLNPFLVEEKSSAFDFNSGDNTVGKLNTESDLNNEEKYTCSYIAFNSSTDGAAHANRNNSANFDGLGGVLQPMHAGQSIVNSTVTTSMNETKSVQEANGKAALLSGDLDASLASLAENLTINTRVNAVKGVQWNSPKGSSKSSSWSPQPISGTNGANYKPMNQSINTGFTVNANIMQAPQMQMYTSHGAAMHTISANSTMGLGPNSANTLGQQPLLFH